MKKFEIEAKIPVTAISTEIYDIEADTEEEALRKFKIGDFDEVYAFIDSYGVDDVEHDTDAFSKAEIVNIEEYD